MWIMFWSSLEDCWVTRGRFLARYCIRETGADRSDDINKFLWMVRIAQGVWPDEIQEANYFTQRGEYAVDERA